MDNISKELFFRDWHLRCEGFTGGEKLSNFYFPLSGCPPGVVSRCFEFFMDYNLYCTGRTSPLINQAGE